MGLIFETNGVIYDGAVAPDATGKLHPATVALTPNAKTAYMNEVTAGNQPRPIPDYMNALYNIYVVGNMASVAPAQVSDLPGEDTSGKIGYPPVAAVAPPAGMAAPGGPAPAPAAPEEHCAE